MKLVRGLVLVVGFLSAFLPLLWMGLSSIKHRDATISQHPKMIPALAASDTDASPLFVPNLDAYRGLGELHAGAQHSFWHHLQSK